MTQTLSSRRQWRRELSVLLAQSATPATLSPTPCASCWPNPPGNQAVALPLTAAAGYCLRGDCITIGPMLAPSLAWCHPLTCSTIPLSSGSIGARIASTATCCQRHIGAAAMFCSAPWWSAHIIEPRVTLQVRGKPVSFLVDTGAAYSVLTEPMGPMTSKKTSVQGATGQIACFPWTSKRTVDLGRTR
ncbi:hypothetical protein QTO34_004506 [Cnephaeus nilssonii]|uniref:Peptidase A2 domain-containing protein n=1 Tax=Cnephaeus nilssonii TaxID=3371016 RepID=A0AA40LKG2_CNENI|nr:hypothetical protein QTO34_004506 [Eptesicus nilssonii]